MFKSVADLSPLLRLQRLQEVKQLYTRSVLPLQVCDHCPLAAALQFLEWVASTCRLISCVYSMHTWNTECAVLALLHSVGCTAHSALRTTQLPDAWGLKPDLPGSALQKAAGPAEQAACHKNLAAYHMYYASVEDEEHSRLDEVRC